MDPRAVPCQDEMPSERLMARYQRRLDPAAFEQLVSRFLAPALAVAQQILSDRALAEDAVQETFLRLVRGRERYCPSKPFSTWFYTILRNVCRDMLRRRVRRAKLLEEMALREAAGLQELCRDRPDAWELLAELPEKTRAVLVLRVVHELPFRDVAVAVGISEEAAKKRAQRALRLLRERCSVTQWHTARPTRDRARRQAAAEGAFAGLAQQDVPGSAS